MTGWYRIIKDDLFGIARELKSIDRGYFVVYSYRDARYEIHNNGNRGNTFCFAAKKLDRSVTLKARKTRSERLRKLLEETERENEKVLELAKARTVKKIEEGAERALSRGYA